MQQRHRLILALVIAAGGAYVGFRALDRSATPGPTSHSAPVSASVRQELTPDRLTVRPTAETLPTLLASSQTLVERQSAPLVAHLGLSEGAGRDLADAFRERFETTLDGDFDRSAAWLRARGDTISTEALERDRDPWNAQADAHRLARCAPEQIETRLLYEQGRRMVPDPLHEGYGVLTTSPAPGRFPLPGTAEEGGLTVIEVRLPFEKSDVMTKRPRPTLLGYQFAWSSSRDQWLPWRIVVYSDPNDAHVGVLF